MDGNKELLNTELRCERIGHDDRWRILSLGVLDEEKKMLVLYSFDEWVTNEEKDIFMFPIRTVGWGIKEQEPRVVGIYIRGYLIKAYMSLEVEGDVEEGECTLWWKLLELIIPKGLLNKGHDLENVKELVIRMIEMGGVSMPRREEAKAGPMDRSQMAITIQPQGKHKPQYTLDEALMAEWIRVQGVRMKFIREEISKVDEEWLNTLNLPGGWKTTATFSFWAVNERKDIFLYGLGGKGWGEIPKYFGLYIQGYNVQIETFWTYDSQTHTKNWKLDKIIMTKGLVEYGYTPYKLTELIKQLFKIYNVNDPERTQVKQVAFPYIGTPIIVEGGKHGES